MRATLIPHPTTPCDAVSTIEAFIECVDGELLLSYLVTGNIQAIRVAQHEAPLRTDKLWEHTCFEAFARPATASSYVELNFAPSSRWAAYRFQSYRAGSTDLPIDADPHVTSESDADTMRLDVELPAAAVLLGDGPWRVALSAVIEEISGRKSYWAVAHPDAARADFHHADAFMLEIDCERDGSGARS